MNGMDLFSGIGGITYALKDFIKPVCYCEIEPFCQSVLLQRMQEGHLPKAPIWDDVRTLSFYPLLLPIDIIYGGFPCTDISCAGLGAGLEGKQSGLFFEIVRLCGEIKPKWIFLENVPAITTRGGTEVVREIAALGYDCRWCVISAASVGAMHKRDRWFLLANTDKNTGRRIIRELSKKDASKQKPEEHREENAFKLNDGSKDACNSHIIPGEQTDTSTITQHGQRNSRGEHPGLYRPFESREHWQKVKCELGGMVNGLSHTMDTNQKGVICAKKTKDIKKEMPAMPESLREEEIWRTFRRFYEIQEKEILFDSMFCPEQNEGFSYKVEYWKALPEEKKESLRELFIYRKFKSTSQRRQSLQQSSIKLDDALQFLSHKIASFTRRHFTEERENAMYLLREIISSTWIMSHAFRTIEEKWTSLSEEEKDWTIMGCFYGMWWGEPPNIERANIGLPNGVDRLRALGNAVVPQQVRKAWEILLKL